ncbi:respiratory nitrate reductase subunit gamma [Neoactinobaculum massilliense]|uniref:respiratory nitrate reductase subunit gamma n=1 Tax=Neoactinobaculum massilliense TaxID=2364794 RepID=UPI000F51E433|nr:respiratory nitrate reductase subunit gamma [Neoactinobaculum massilliense]
MNALAVFFWAIFPYACMVACIGGLAWRWHYDQFGWTSRSSELHESTWLRLGSPLFHYGIILVFFGHVMGLLIPKSWTEGAGIGEHTYHAFAVIGGSVAGLMTAVGLVILIIRRWVNRGVRRATTRGDVVMYVFLTLAIALGLSATIATQVAPGLSGGYNYRETISVWLRSLFTLQPQISLMTAVPAVFKMHIVAGFLLFAILPNTRLVHIFSAPLGYVTRPYVVYRSRAEATAAAPVRRGWSKPRDWKGESAPSA